MACCKSVGVSDSKPAGILLSNCKPRVDAKGGGINIDLRGNFCVRVHIFQAAHLDLRHVIGRDGHLH